MSEAKEFDVIIWGATGFTGRLVAEYYLKQYGVNGDLKWAMAGRSQSKLEQVRAELGNNDVPMVVADSHNRKSLDSLVNRTKVICTTVGPYAKYGSELVAACVENGTDYCDLAGEMQWINRMIAAHHQQAQQKGVRIVHCCGFDSIPSDLGVYFLQQQAKQQKGDYCHTVKMRVYGAKGGFSGGTYDSLNNLLIEAQQDAEVRKQLHNPYSLNPEGEQSGQDKGELRSVKYDPDAESWIAPFVMEGINARVVRRSHALAGYPYGKQFQYSEASMTGPGFGGRVKAVINWLVTGALTAGKPGSFYRRQLERFLPKPGEGPSAEEREAGFFNLRFIGLTNDGEKITAKVTGDRDPGYGSTSKMLGEAAACLSLDQASTPDVSGVLTPSVALGDTLLHRLEKNAGLKFTLR